MKNYLILASLLAISLCSCNKKKHDNEVVSQRFIHKYGYAVSQDEWNTHSYPGQVVEHLRTGVTLTKTYEAGMLHGPTTATYPDSEVVASLVVYDKGSVVKELRYDVNGMPKEQKVILSPTRYQLTRWYADGTPSLIEEYAGNEVLEGQYFTPKNELDAKVEKGNGLRLTRSAGGKLMAKEMVQAGYPTEKETYFPSGALESVAHYQNGKLTGEYKLFAQSGEPVRVEEYVANKLHGKATYYRNGSKHIEVSFLDGDKNGLEKHFIDGNQVSYQVLWENNRKHGAEEFLTGDTVKARYYYNGESVSKARYEELQKLDDIASTISSDVRYSY